MAHAVQTAASTQGILDLVNSAIVAPVAGFLNSLYRAATTDFDTAVFAAKSNLELADIGLRRDHVALVVAPHHLDA